jgi:RNA polymerase sigma-70 factor (ECF subfamily)
MTDSLERVREQLIELLPRLRRFARTLTRHADDADDVVQLALGRALARHEQWDPASRLDSWMYGIVRNAWIDELRARRRRGQPVDMEEVAEAGIPDPNEAESDMMSVQEALARLPEEQRTAVMLVLVEGLSYKEAAAAMNVPIGTLTSRLARGREALQSLLGGEGSS